MKVILFLAAIYTLIIYEVRQKKTVVLPLPAAPATDVVRPIAEDSIYQAPSIMAVGYHQKQKQKIRQQAGVIPQYSIYSWH